MRSRLILVPTLVVALFVFPSSASATGDLLDYQSAVDAMHAVDPTLEPPPNDGKHDFAVGGVQDAFGLNHGISAHSGPQGQDPFGKMTTKRPAREGAKELYNVVCLAVVGNVAAIGVRGEVFSNPSNNKFPVTNIWVVQDNGPGGEFDRLTAVGPNIGEPENCESGLALAATAPFINNGNILVHDATLP
jgi:hypothetical protein